MSTYSMTGFGRSQIINDNIKINIEIKSVNSRYFDLNIKMPKFLNPFEIEIKKKINNIVSRAKIDCYITYEDYTKKEFKLFYNKNIAKKYYDVITEIAKDFSIETNLNAINLSKQQDVLIIDEDDIDSNAIISNVYSVLDKALKEYNITRMIEGENLKKDLLVKIVEIETSLELIEERSKQIIFDYKNNLIEKIKDLVDSSKINIDDNRIMMEVALYADKICIDEEIVRLKTHINRFKNLFDKNIPIGKELDFLTQEMNREANTMLSKTQDLKSSNEALTIKTNIEKIREQVQNIE